MEQPEDWDEEVETEKESQPEERIYSYTKLTNFLSCRYSFYKRYINHAEPKVEGIERFLGSRVHDGVQHVYNAKKENGAAPSLAETMQFYSDRWDGELTKLMEAGHSIVAVQDMDGFKVQVAATDEELNAAKLLGRKMVEGYYTKFTPFKDDMEIEKEIIFNLEGRKVKVKIDGLVIQGTKRKVVELKTSKNIGLNVHGWRRQVSLYMLGVKEYEREQGRTVEVEPFLYHLTSGTHVAIPGLGTPGDLANTREWALSTIKEVERVTKDWTLLNPKEYPCEPYARNLCPWCPYFEECPKWKQPVRLRKLLGEARDQDEGVRLLQEYKFLHEMLAETEAKIKEYAQREGVSVVDGLGVHAYLSRVPVLPDKKTNREKYEDLEDDLKELGNRRINGYYGLNTYQLRSDLVKGKLDPEVEKVVREHILGEELSVFIPIEEKGKFGKTK